MDVVVAGVVLGAVVNNIVTKISSVIDTRFTEVADLRSDVSSLKTELEAIGSTLDNLQNGKPTKFQRSIMSKARELAFDTEDCIDKFLPCPACEGVEVPTFSSVDFAIEVKKLKKRSKEAKDLIKDYCDKHSPQATDVAGKSAGSGAVASKSSAAYLVGVEKPKDEIVSLLSCQNLAVISIVGFGGSGKTVLAKAVYNCPQVQTDFGLRSWVVASKHKDGDELRLAILKGLFPGEPEDSTFQERITDQKQQNKRCLIVIDDMIKPTDWNRIKSLLADLPVKILLTTTLQSVANTCTADRGYIYNMRTLSDEDSTNLLKKMVHKLDGTSNDLVEGSAAIVRKCHGHPLALISVANYLINQGQDTLTGKDCHDTSSLLCALVDENEQDIFKELRQVLENKYTGLPADIKRCLLYTSLFPNGRPLSCKTLTSRWLAEGYIGAETQRSNQEVADKNMKKLMDHNIFRPTDAVNSGKAKKCKPHGIMHQFMLYKSISSNFIATSLGKRRNFRHLVIENDGAGMDYGDVPDGRPKNTTKRIFPWDRKKISKEASEELRPRSLAVFGSAEETVYSNLLKCKLLRVLDLKECMDSLGEHHKDNICKLLHLKYLTLGSSVLPLPVEMKKLHCLETLDLRKTGIAELHVEVICLPHLAHLFGKFKLQNISGENQETLIGRKSNLQTLAGVVVDKYSLFPKLMHHMKRLSEVKIWCEITGTNINDYTLLSRSIQLYCESGLSTGIDTRSLSLHLSYPSTDLLRCHVNCGFLTALKLHGRPNRFTEFVKSLSGLKELCLTAINLKKEDLAALGTLPLLVCLKLVQDNLEGLHINKSEGFNSLQRLCLVLKEPRFPTIEKEALPTLTSIQMLCEGLKDLGGFKMENFKRLCEVALDSKVTPGTRKLWEDAANRNTNKRPRIVFLERVDPADIRSAVKYVATDKIPAEPNIDQTPSGTPVLEIDANQIQSGPPMQGVATDQISSGSQVPEITIDQIISGPLVQGVVINGIPSGPPVQAVARFLHLGARTC